MFDKITKQLVENLNIKPKIIVLNGSGFRSDYAYKYYLKLREYNVKHYIKCNIAINVESRIILYSQAVKSPKHDTKFAIAAIRSLKKYKIQYIITNKVYDTEPPKKLYQRRNQSSKPNTSESKLQTLAVSKISQKIFKEIYLIRNNVESVIKRKFGEINKIKSQD